MPQKPQYSAQIQPLPVAPTYDEYLTRQEYARDREQFVRRDEFASHQSDTRRDFDITRRSIEETTESVEETKRSLIDTLKQRLGQRLETSDPGLGSVVTSLWHSGPIAAALAFAGWLISRRFGVVGRLGVRAAKIVARRRLRRPSLVEARPRAERAHCQDLIREHEQTHHRQSQVVTQPIVHEHHSHTQVRPAPTYVVQPPQHAPMSRPAEVEPTYVVQPPPPPPPAATYAPVSRPAEVASEAPAPFRGRWIWSDS